MARRAPRPPSSELHQEMSARWRYLLRHPDFRADVRELRKQYKEAAYDAGPAHEQLVEKWNLKELPVDIRTCPYIPDDPPYKNGYYERFSPDAIIKYPVEARDLAEEDSTPSRLPLDIARGQFLQLTVDLSYPDTLLLGLIQEEISTARRQKRHIDKHDTYLKVYDLAEQGKTLSQIAQETHSNLPTVKAQFRTACERIYGAGNIPEKWRLTLSGFNAATHLEECAQCRDALSKGENWSEDQLCPKAAIFFGQDHVAQRELPVQDIESLSRSNGHRSGTQRPSDDED